MISVLLDSSNTRLAVGIANEQRVIDSISYEAWQQQSEYMIPELDKLLTKHIIDRRDINEIVVAIGPGSYTGIRIAITIAKVLGLATKAKVIPISSLQILQNPQQTSICVMNARSNRSYVGVYKQNEIVLPDCIMGNEELMDLITQHPSYEVCGDCSYLKINSVNNDVIENMFILKNKVNPIDDVLALKPVYLKD